MNSYPTTGLFICRWTNGVVPEFTAGDLKNFAKKLEHVKKIWIDEGELPPDAKILSQEIKENGIERLVIAGHKPGFYLSLFKRAMVLAGKDPENINMISFHERGIHSSMLAEARLFSALHGYPFEMAAIPDDNPVNKETMVIGGGIAGIQASLEIANAGYKVCLVEKSGTIGGHMAMFDKTFPTLDCAACILTPKMVEVGQHPNIELITYAEVESVQGQAGNFKVKVLKKARRVDLATCIGCGTCSEKCPARAISEFDAGTSLRKAIYIPFPQAVPNKYLIDAEACTYVQKGKCGVCAKVCPVEDCINLDEQDERVDIEVGNIILATGFTVFDASQIENLGYGKYPNVVTSLEFERLINAAGPTGGSIRYRGQDKRGNWIFSPDNEQPSSVALIHCVGSRDERYNKHCSRVCCMYSLKLAHLVKEKLPDAEVSEYYIDMRAYGKGYEEFYERIKSEGINVIRGRTATVVEQDGQLLLRTEDIIHDRLLEKKADMVILSIGLEPSPSTAKLANMLHIPRDESGFFREFHQHFDITSTTRGGIHLAGTCKGPKDIPDSVAEASAAAARVIQSLSRGKIKQGLSEMDPNQIMEETRKLVSQQKDQ